MSTEGHTALDALSAEQRDILGHALGMNHTPRVERNYYCASLVDGAPPRDIAELVERGLLRPGRAVNEGRDRYYFATPAGIEVAKQARYQRLKLSDVDPDLTFDQYLQLYLVREGKSAP